MSITLDTIEANLHSIKISNGTYELALDSNGYITANINGSVAITDGGGSITVDGTVAATQSGTWNIGTLGTITNVVHVDDNAGSITVDATALDIRALSNATDSVTAHQGGSWTVAATQSGSWTVSTIPGAFASWQTSKVSVTSSATQIAATPLTNRAKMIVQNLGSSDCFVSNSNSVTANDLKLPKGSSFEIELAAGASLYAITASGSTDVRVAEFAA